LIFSAAVLAVFAGLGLMLSLMEGFRRAYREPRDSLGLLAAADQGAAAGAYCAGSAGAGYAGACLRPPD